jgi:hypothetical protein
MVVLGGALLGIGLLGFLGYKFHGRFSQKDPPALLKQHVATMQETYAGLFHAKLVECSYDVQKTDSLVSPYIGSVNYTEDMGAKDCTEAVCLGRRLKLLERNLAVR